MNSQNINLPIEKTSAPNFEILTAIKQAWAGVSGTKASFVGAFFLQLLVSVGIGLILEIFTGPNPKEGNLFTFVINIFAGIIGYVLAAGLIMMAVRKAQGANIKAMMVFDQFSHWLSILLLMILVSILTVIGFIFFILPGIYLAVAYGFALPLLLDKKLGIWESMEASRKLISSAWFRYFFTYLLMSIIISLSVIPLGIGLIWTVPMSLILYGNLYQSAFGNSEKHS